MILNYAKTVMAYFFELSLKEEMIIIWLYFMFWILCFFVSLALFSRTRNYMEIISKATKSNKTGDMDYLSAFRSVKWEILSLFCVISTTISLYPAIIFSLKPPTIMPQKTFI